MHRVIVGMDERVMDVGDSFSQLHTHVELWLLQQVGPLGESWHTTYESGAGYCVDFVTESDAIKFKLSWL